MDNEELINDSEQTEENTDRENGAAAAQSVCCCDKEVEDDYVSVPISVRLRNWPVWLAVLGSVGIILNSAGVFAKWGLDTDAWNTIVNAIGGVFIALGVVNNPTDLKHF